MAGDTARSPGRWPVELVELAAADGRRLEGLLHEPAGDPRVHLLLLHGKGGNCYSGVARFLPPALAGHGVRTLALNMRCHDLGYTRLDVPFVDQEKGNAAVDGGMWESCSTAELDVAAGVRLLRSAGPAPVVLAGHSSGAFHLVCYAAGDSAIAGRVLLSPLVSNRRPLLDWFGGASGLAAAEATAREEVRRGNGDVLLPVRTWYYAVSARSLVERLDEESGGWEAALRANTSPVLMLWGGAETRYHEWRRMFDRIPVTKRRVVLPRAEHHYLGQESQVAGAIARFLDSLVLNT